MKRIPFSEPMKLALEAGKKTITTRKASFQVSPGDILHCVCPAPGKPWFYTPATEAFAVIEVLGVHECAMPLGSEMNAEERNLWGVAEGFENFASFESYLLSLYEGKCPERLNRIWFRVVESESTTGAPS